MLNEDNIVRWQLWAAAAYLALVPSNAVTFGRSLAFGFAAMWALVILVAGWLGRGRPVPPPGRASLIAFGAWCAWCTASVIWSASPSYSANQLHREIGWTILAMLAFYVAPRDHAAWRGLVAVSLVAFAGYASLALVMTLSAGGWDPSHWHSGVGPYSTYVVLVAPFLLVLIAPRPVGFGAKPASIAAGLALLALLLASARVTDNRMVWIALAAVCANAAAIAALRWKASLVRAPLRFTAPLAALLVVLAVLFVDAARERAHALFPPQTTVTETLVADPRLPLWDETSALIHARPLTGFGFGRAIVAGKLKGALGNPMLWHAHNVFMSQFVQTGGIGFALFLAALVAVCARFVAFVRAPDDSLATVGIIGISIVVGFVVKNLTDDFLFRSNAKEFWGLLALVLGYGAVLERDRHAVAAARQPAPVLETA